MPDLPVCSRFCTSATAVNLVPGTSSPSVVAGGFIVFGFYSYG